MATLIVTNLNDSGAGSLRAQVAAANASVGVADTIVFANGLSGTLILTSGELALTDDVTINGDTTGDNKAEISISGNNTSRIFNQSGFSTDVVIQSLTLANGNAGNTGDGGAIKTFGGSLTIQNTTIFNNVAFEGGGVYATATNVSISNSLLSQNTALGLPGSGGVGGGIKMYQATLTLVNATLADNISKRGAGAIHFDGQSTYSLPASVNLINSTIIGNHSLGDTQSGGQGPIPASGGIVGTLVNVTNSVIAGNTVGSNTISANDIIATTINADHSAFGSNAALTTNTLSLINVSAADIGLGLLGNHGGTTETFDIASKTSVLFNAGSNAGATGILTDANGNVRVQSGTTDIGATEYSEITVTNLNDSGAGSLRAAITQANAKPGYDHIVFQSGLTGTIQTASTLVLTNQITIDGDTDGNGDANITIGSNGTDHTAFIVIGSATATLSSLAISGMTKVAGVSAISNAGNLTLSNMVISNNIVTGGGVAGEYGFYFDGTSGETILNSGTLTINQTEFSGNQQTGQILNVYGGTGGAAATIVNFGGITMLGVAFLNEISQGGNGYHGQERAGNGGAGGDGGAAAAGVLNFGTLTGGNAFISSSVQVIGGAGGQGGASYGGGSSGANGTTGATSLANLDQGGGTSLVLNENNGNQFANAITGGGFTQTFGLAGDDTLSISASGNLFGGSGNDRLVVTNLLTAGTNSNWDGGLGRDTLDLSGNAVSAVINLQARTNDFGATLRSIENLIGTSAIDTLTGDAGDNVIQGRGAGDTLDGGANGAAGDTLSYSNSTSGVTVNIATNTASGGDAQGDVISGFENIIGSSQQDVLTAGAGNNVLSGGAGADTLNGGTDNDTASYVNNTAGVTVLLKSGIAIESSGVNDTLISIENVTGSNFNDTLEGNGLANVLDGGNGLDTAYYYSSVAGVTVNLATGIGSGGDAAGDTFASVEYVIGSNSAGDTLTGNGVINYLAGQAGNDTIDGGGVASASVNTTTYQGDSLDGGEGTDTLSYASATQQVVVIMDQNSPTSGIAWNGTSGDLMINFENLTGSAHNDVLLANNAANRINGGAGQDSLYGKGGADTFHFDALQLDAIHDFQDGLDKLSFNQAIADSFSDFQIFGNGGTDYLAVQLISDGSLIVLKGAGTSSVTLTADDFVFV
jgi:Ca2+-binding RTX toxin-like protein